MLIRGSLQNIFDNKGSNYILDSDLCDFSEKCIYKNTKNIPRLFQYGIKERNVSFPCVKSIYLGPRMRTSVKQNSKLLFMK